MIVLKVEGPTPTLEGFRYFWAKYVSGFDKSQHCARCLVGDWSRYTKTNMVAGGMKYIMGESQKFDYLYICGVAYPWSWPNNFHMVMRPKVGSFARMETWNGFVLTAKDAELLNIPHMPLGYRGYGKAFTTCRNFQFGWAAYAARDRSRLIAAS
jgi:hypothetical protein